ncbi:MAG: hypothetical protein EA351_08500 [Gemmatimonadales bacterium]|nr:MAG: hypothetical protein EA351_08500 [Gemmatimonadales bacterium]
MVRFRGRLDYLLDLHLRDGLGSLRSGVTNLLRMGAYQLFHMGSVPGYAAVSETVDQVQALAGKGLAGMTNGVLRSLGREGADEARFPSFDEDPRGYLTSWGSHPRWLIDRWVERWGPDEVRRLVEFNNTIPGLYLRLMAGGETTSSAVSRLAGVGIEARPGPPGSRTVRLEAGTDPLRALGALPSIVQDPAAAWVVAHAGPVSGLEAADLCAAPGGKTMGLWSEGARVVALDRSAPRLARVGETSRRLRARIPSVVAAAESVPLRPRDLILVDAPCTGTGTLARHPDARWRLGPGDIEVMARVQDRILEGAATAVRSGGLLLYSTCSLEPEENEDRVEVFLREHPEFILEEAPDSGERPPGDAMDGAFLRALPHRTETDGAFAARLRRR